MDPKKIKTNSFTPETKPQSQLQVLRVNRFLYKAEVSPVTENPVYMSSTIDSSQKAKTKQGNSAGERGNAKEIITGTVITSCLMKSSDGDDRIEIGQNLEFAGGTSDVDYLAAFNGNSLAVLITKFGITVLNLLVENNLSVIGTFQYSDGENSLVTQPVTYWLRLVGGAQVRNNTNNSWSVSHSGTGEYTVTHNLGHDYYAVQATISSEVGWLVGGFAATSFVDINSFIINTFDDTGTPVDADWSCTVSVSPNPPV